MGHGMGVTASMENKNSKLRDRMCFLCRAG